MPTISRFHGISITVCFDDHGYPHFHARHADGEAKILIDSLEILDSSLDRRTRDSAARCWPGEPSGCPRRAAGSRWSSRSEGSTVSGEAESHVGMTSAPSSGLSKPPGRRSRPRPSSYSMEPAGQLPNPRLLRRLRSLLA
ncbi:MAG: DUF4160 domain-containing protein [Chloroflexi bacterium]|nr:DUF4160 domain-containing protein [Chloroflexota bacterium]